MPSLPWTAYHLRGKFVTVRVMRVRTKRLLRRFRRVDNEQYIPTLVGLSIVVTGIITTMLLAGVVRDQNNRVFANQEYQVSSTVVRYLADKIERYEQLLIGAGALFDVKKEVTREDWRQFADSVKVGSGYPALLGIGYVDAIPAPKILEHEEEMKAQGLYTYSVRPKNAQERYHPIVFIEPQNETNQRALGFDMSSEPIRAAAMKRAMETATAVLSGPVQLVQDESEAADLYGSLMYYPVYSSPTVPTTVAERESALEGFVYAVFRPQDIFNTIPNRLLVGDITRVRLSDVSDKTIDMFDAEYPLDAQGGAFTTTQLFDVSNRTWQLKITAYDDVASRRLTPLLILIIGSIISVLLAMVAYAGLLHRIHRIERLNERRVQKSKDDLLAIASHQLRTPASGVKQYIGMLLQGFIGPLTPEQEEIATKAYDANERQLEIINELLYVAKADAGQLFIDRSDVDLRELVATCINEQTDKAKAKNLTVKFGRSKPVPISVDAQFIRMIVENLLSNAIKYSYPNSTIRVTLTTAETNVTVSVKDSGVGISQSEQYKLFKKFSRVENPLSRSEGGSGLGLFLARRLAEAHGGTVRVTSQKNRGSTFILDLPLRTKATNTVALE
jgi:signal transduction histidine kinase